MNVVKAPSPEFDVDCRSGDIIVPASHAHKPLGGGYDQIPGDDNYY